MTSQTQNKILELLETYGCMTLDNFVLKMPMERRHSLRGRLSELVSLKLIKKIGNEYVLSNDRQSLEKVE